MTTNDEIRNATANNLAPLLEIAQAMTKFNHNIRIVPFEDLTQDAWEDVQTVSETVDILCGYVIDTIVLGSQMIEDDGILESTMKFVSDQ